MAVTLRPAEVMDVEQRIQKMIRRGCVTTSNIAETLGWERRRTYRFLSERPGMFRSNGPSGARNCDNKWELV